MKKLIKFIIVAFTVTISTAESTACNQKEEYKLTSNNILQQRFHNYQCGHCYITIQSYSAPSGGSCPKGSFHSWYRLD